MNTAIVLTIISPDHPGIIQSVSSVLKKHGGNWTRSSMSTLAGQFAFVGGAADGVVALRNRPRPLSQDPIPDPETCD